MIHSYFHWEIPQVWPTLRPYIQKAHERGCCLSMGDIYEHLCDSTMQVYTWETPDLEAVVTTAIQDDNCHIVTASGKNFKDWIGAISYIERWAKENGCKSMIIQGRKGWSRALGYTITGRDPLNLHIMEKPL